jgi:hypothetical protein
LSTAILWKRSADLQLPTIFYNRLSNAYKRLRVAILESESILRESDIHRSCQLIANMRDGATCRFSTNNLPQTWSGLESLSRSLSWIPIEKHRLSATRRAETVTIPFELRVQLHLLLKAVWMTDFVLDQTSQKVAALHTSEPAATLT